MSGQRDYRNPNGRSSDHLLIRRDIAELSWHGRKSDGPMARRAMEMADMLAELIGDVPPSKRPRT